MKSAPCEYASEYVGRPRRMTSYPAWTFIQSPEPPSALADALNRQPPIGGPVGMLVQVRSRSWSPGHWRRARRGWLARVVPPAQVADSPAMNADAAYCSGIAILRRSPSPRPACRRSHRSEAHREASFADWLGCGATFSAMAYGESPDSTWRSTCSSHAGSYL